MLNYKKNLVLGILPLKYKFSKFSIANVSQIRLWWRLKSEHVEMCGWKSELAHLDSLLSSKQQTRIFQRLFGGFCVIWMLFLEDSSPVEDLLCFQCLTFPSPLLWLSPFLSKQITQKLFMTSSWLPGWEDAKEEGQLYLCKSRLQPNKVFFSSCTTFRH